MPDANKAPRRQQMRVRELADRWLWSATVQVDAEGTFYGDRPWTEIMAGALLSIMDATKGTDKQLGHLLLELRNFQRMLTPPLPKSVPGPAADRAKREAASRARAWAAYKAAGGTMEAEGDVVDPVALTAPVEALNLSYRARRVITFRAKAQTVGELVKLTANELLELRGFGESSLAEVRGALAKRGLALAGEPEGGSRA